MCPKVWRQRSLRVYSGVLGDARLAGARSVWSTALQYSLRLRNSGTRSRGVWLLRDRVVTRNTYARCENASSNRFCNYPRVPGENYRLVLHLFPSRCAYFVHWTTGRRTKRGSEKGHARTAEKGKTEGLYIRATWPLRSTTGRSCWSNFKWWVLFSLCPMVFHSCCTHYYLHPAFLSIAGFISMLSWKPTLVGPTPGVAALHSVYSFFTPSLREISNVSGPSDPFDTTDRYAWRNETPFSRLIVKIANRVSFPILSSGDIIHARMNQWSFMRLSRNEDVNHS